MGGGGGVTWVNFCSWYVPLASQNPYPIIVYSVAILQISCKVTLGKK